MAAHRARVQPLLLFAARSSADEAPTELRLMDIMDGTVVRVIKRPGVCTFSYRLDGPVCVCLDYVGVKSSVNAIDLATGAVMKASAQLSRESFWDLNVGCASSAPPRAYKVVCLTSKYCKVLTLEDGARWRQVQSPPKLLTANICNDSNIVTVNGVMHFLTVPGSPQLKEIHVHRFDLESEEWMASIKGPM